jgi:hypothetical protein
MNNIGINVYINVLIIGSAETLAYAITGLNRKLVKII